MQILDALTTVYSDVPGRLLQIVCCLAAFIVLGCASIAMTERRHGPVRLSVVWKKLFPAERYSHVTAKMDKINFVVSTLLFLPIIKIVFLLIGGIEFGRILDDLFGRRAPLIANETVLIGVQIAGLYVIGEVVFFIDHWLSHKVDFLWGIHRVHHSVEEMTIFAGFSRAHPLEAVQAAIGGLFIGGALTGAMLFALGAPLHPSATAGMVVYAAVIPLLFLLHHSHVSIPFGKLNYIFSGPAMHQLHHSAEWRHRDRNFAATLTLLDWICGTLYIPKPDERYRWGLNEAEYGANNPHITIKAFYLEPFAYCWRSLTRRRAVPPEEAESSLGART